MMVNSPTEGKRRFSDQTLAMNINLSSGFDDLASSKRRQTIGGHVRPRPSSDVTAVAATLNVLPTPTKRKVNLGSTAASAYYFSGMPNTPLSAAKSTSKTGDADARKPIENPFPDSDDSIQSNGNNDVMNRSVLSDTTELTASNFVRVASSRMQVTGFTNDKFKYALQSESLAPSVVGDQTEDSSGVITGSSSLGKISTSPSSLRKFTRTLKQTRLQSDDGFERSSIGSLDVSAIVPSLPSPVSKVSHESIKDRRSPRELDVSLRSLDDLFDGLLGTTRITSPESSSLLASPHSSADRSPLLEADSSPTEVEEKTSPSSFVSPGMSPINGDHASEPLRLTPSKSSMKLTPTKLNPSPRRVSNPNAADSPARNTRSAAKNSSIDQLGMANGIHETGMSLGPGSPSPNITPGSSGPSRAFKLDNEQSRVNKSTTTSMYSSDIIDSKRRRSESGGYESDHPGEPGKRSKGGNFWDVRLPSAGGSFLQTSKSESASAPKSILNSSMKKQNASDSQRRKTVAFGSPEAAEYHIGSPSVSLTPMPSNRAKAMFSIPSALSIADSNSSVASDSIDSSVHDDETVTVDIEINVNEMLKRASDYLEPDSHKLHSIDTSSTLSPLLQSSSFVDRPNKSKSGTSSSVAQLIDSTFDQMSGEVGTTEADAHSLFFNETKPFELESPISLQETSNPSERQCDGLNEPQPLISSDAVVEPATSEGRFSTMTLADNASMNLDKAKTLDDLASAVDSMASSPFHSIGVWTDEDNTVELEADLSAILAMASQGSDGYDSLPALKLADRFPKTTSALVPATLRLSFGLAAVPKQISEGLTSGRFDFGLSESPGSTSTHSRRSDSSRKRFSLARAGRISIASEGSLLDLSRMDNAINEEETDAGSHLENVDIDDTEEQFTITWKEIDQLVGPGGCLPTTNLNSGFQSSVQSLFATENVRYSQVSDSIVSFATAVCGEVEEKAHLNSESEACFSELVESLGDQKVRLQSWLREPTGQYEAKSVATAIRRIVDHEWSGWEKIVLDSLTAAIAQIGAELEPESYQLEDSMTALYHLNDLLSISAGKAARRARRRSMARHEVSVHA